MAEIVAYLPEGFGALAARYCARMPGDHPSIAAAMFALETGRGVAPGRGGQLYRDHGNLWCIKGASDRRYQGPPTGDGYATYPGGHEQCWQDRLRILAMYRGWAISRGLLHNDVLGMCDSWWAPNQAYREKVTSIIITDQLHRLDRKPSL